MKIRDYFDSFSTTEVVEGITEQPTQYGYINSRNYFNMKSTSDKAIIFDKDYSNITLLPQVNRGAKAATQGKERTADTFALKLAYFKHADRLTGDDIQSHRAVGREDNETLARATAEKLEDMRRTWDQTEEYLKLNAIKGVFKTPDGAVVADMFSEFGVTQVTHDFDLGTNTTDIDIKIRKLKESMAKSVKTGGAISGIEILVDSEFFDKLISHPQMKNAYQFYLNSGSQMLRDNLSEYMKWGIMNEFTHRGVRFLTYDAEFNLPNDTTEKAFEASTGLAIPLGVKDMFRGYHGPSAKMSAANQPGQPLYVRTYVDDHDEFVEFELESSPLYFATRPLACQKLISST